jgi:chromosome segregation protein
VADAIRWVMGEQSVKNLRGKKTEDVIFNGSEVKGQLSAAEVTMVLDNNLGASGSAQTKVMQDYPEITVSRRLYRSGESEYLINNNPVRLLDIHMFLAQAQFAQHSYSVIGQGTIDKLLTVSPAERKDFLDEASGIKEFQIKQHQSSLKMARTRENLEQAERLVQEVEPRLKILARQVKKLEKREEIEIELRENQQKYFTSVYLANKLELDKFNLTLSGVEVNYRQTFQELNEVQTELSVLARASTRQEIFNDLQAKFQLLVHEKNDLERQLAIKDGQMKTEYNKEGKQNIGWLENKIGLKITTRLFA